MSPLPPSSSLATDSEIEDIMNDRPTVAQRIWRLERVHNNLEKLHGVENPKVKRHIELSDTLHGNNCANFALHLRQIELLEGYLADVPAKQEVIMVALDVWARSARLNRVSPDLFDLTCQIACVHMQFEVLLATNLFPPLIEPEDQHPPGNSSGERADA